VAWRGAARPGMARHGVARLGSARQGKVFLTRRFEMRFLKSADAKILESVLSECAIGQTVTYEELSKAIGRDVRVFAKGALDTARKGCFREKKAVFGVETNVGFIRLDDSQIVSSSDKDVTKIRRSARRSLNKLEVVDFNSLSEPMKKKHVAMSAQIGVVQFFSTTSAAKKIEGVVSNKTSILPIGETLKLFGDSR